MGVVLSLSEEQLAKDLAFVLHNRSETTEQFVDALIPLIRQYVAEELVVYQEEIITELTQYFQYEMLNVILQARKHKVNSKYQKAADALEEVEDEPKGKW